MGETGAELKDSRLELEALLSAASLRERAARRKALLYTLGPVALGALFLSVSLYQVSQLQRKAANLNQQIDVQSAELSRKREALANAQTELDKVNDGLLKARTALEGIRQDPKDAQLKAQQALRDLPAISRHAAVPKPPSEEPDAAPNSPKGPWAVAVAADKDLESARNIAAKAQQLGYGQILTCQKKGWWRIVAVFASESEARANLGRIRSSFKGDSAVRDMNKWCPNCKCLN